jgi:hypothetical protein
MELVIRLASNGIVRSVGSVSRDQAAAVVEDPAQDGAVDSRYTPPPAPTGAADMGHLNPSTNEGSRPADSSVEAPPAAAGTTAVHDIGVADASLNVAGGAADCARAIASAAAGWFDIAGAPGATAAVGVAAATGAADESLGGSTGTEAVGPGDALRTMRLTFRQTVGTRMQWRPSQYTSPRSWAADGHAERVTLRQTRSNAKCMSRIVGWYSCRPPIESRRMTTRSSYWRRAMRALSLSRVVESMST